MAPWSGHSAYLTTLADGTVKQVEPFTRTQVWTVAGRADRPIPSTLPPPAPLDAGANRTTCAFCADRYLDTTPEKSRSVRTAEGFERYRNLTLPEVLSGTAEFRRMANLFEILGVDYWELNRGYRLPASSLDHWHRYEASGGGREHLLKLIRIRMNHRAEGLSDDELLAESRDFFGSAHDVITARRHFVDGATTTDQLASSGTLTVDEHREFLDFTLDAMADLYSGNRGVRYVATFQNWLRPAGASFDHLHKQLVGLDEYGPQLDARIEAATRNPHVFNEVLNYAIDQQLVVAATEDAVAIAGFGHRYPSLEVWSRSELTSPWQLPRAHFNAMSDLIHALHVAAGPGVPCNEEWHHRPPASDLEIPWHVVIKWRISTLAGFEGSTSINLNTISPYVLRDRVVAQLRESQAAGRISDSIRVGADAGVAKNPLRYLD